MTLSKETKNKINQFVKQNTKLSVSDSKELTYFEELAIQANQTLGRRRSLLLNLNGLHKRIMKHKKS